MDLVLPNTVRIPPQDHLVSACTARAIPWPAALVRAGDTDGMRKASVREP
jgi:hypothetical protein